MPNRLICGVLDEMRECYKTYNFGAIAGLIEEAQTLANRMEASLYDQADYERISKKRQSIIEESRKTEKTRVKLTRDVATLKDTIASLLETKNKLKAK